jgi:aminopeptidase Y
VTLDGVRAHQAALQTIADANDGIRTSGTPGYDESKDYVVARMTEYGYTVTVQPFVFTTFIDLGTSILDQTAPGAASYVEGIDFNEMSQTDPGDVTASVTSVDLQLGLGNVSTSACEAADFAGFPAGNIALVQRGTCTFESKAENAAAAGASGVIIFNQGNTAARTGLIGGTVGNDYTGGIPVFEATYGRGVEWDSTAGLVMHLFANVFRGSATTYNVLAESSGGNPGNVVMAGAHLDSVNEGPGINDNGSGSAALLEVAEQMAKVTPRNKVRLAWWGAEESGLVGSTHYVNNLSQAERDRIALYLNFDMVGSPNHVFFIYDGDDSDAVGNGAGPAGSAEIEKTFERYFNSVGVPFKGTDFSGRSDYGPFINIAGIPSGGLFTGAEGIKTAAEAAIWGGTAGQQYDPCYHLACDTYANNNNDALDVNSDAIAYSILQYAMSTSDVNGAKGKGNFKLDLEPESELAAE